MTSHPYQNINDIFLEELLRIKNLFRYFYKIKALLFFFTFLALPHLIFTPALSKEKSDKYTQCIEKYGTMNNSAVHKCASEVSEYLKLEIEDKVKKIIKKISKRGGSRNQKDLNAFIQSGYYWSSHTQIYCDLKTKYIGTPMLHYCPMIKLENRLKELEIFLSEIH